MLMLQAACGLSSAAAESSSREVIDRADIVAAHHFENLLRLRAVEVLIGAAGRELRRHHAQVGRDHLLGAVVFSQGRNQFGADLAERARDQDLFHVPLQSVEA